MSNEARAMKVRLSSKHRILITGKFEKKTCRIIQHKINHPQCHLITNIKSDKKTRDFN